MTAKFQELVTKLKEIFQLDKPELDFGLYRIMHAKSAEVTDFLEHRLEAKVREALSSDDIGQAESEVYSHLLTFFSRYYDQGDFISKRRYNGDKYAIPYAGEEVKLYWANADQYYIKSGENFTNYDFTLSDGAKVHFKLVVAVTAKDNIKDADAERRFMLWRPEEASAEDDEDAEPMPTDICEERDGELFIYFQYRKCKKGTKQAALIEEAERLVIDRLAQLQLAMKYPLAVAAPTEKDRNRSLLKKHLERYTAKNTCDYFIHKDLQGFLTRELDFYIKNEMLHLDDLRDAAAIRHIERQLRQINAVRTIAGELIAFMAQLENFQKRLWLKKKFVTRCEWCVTMDRLPEDLRVEALANSQQQEEWRKLGFAEPDGGRQARLPDMDTAIDARMVDTKFFDESFKARLLRAIPDIDEQCNGVLIHAENFQALRLLHERYKETIKSIFIDPPYNTEDSEGENDFKYKDYYQDSSWNTMIFDRVLNGYHLLGKRGIFSCTISDKEFSNLIMILNFIYSSQNRIGIIEWNSTKSVTNKALISMGHTHIPIYARYIDYFVKNRIEFRLPDSEEGFANPDNDPRGKWKADPFQVGGERKNQLYPIVNPRTGVEYRPLPGNSWKNDYETYKKLVADNRIVFGVRGESGPQRKRFWFEAKERGCVPKTWWDTEETTTNGTQLLKNLFSICPFKNPKPIGLLKNIQLLCADINEIILDYFAGSGTTGHAVIALNREDGGNRKYILVEMAEHFDTVLKPRIEKVVYSPDWRNGQPTSADKGISHCFKYMTLESYEDALGNIEPADRGKGLLGLVRDEYLLHYMLDLDARASLINTDSFKHPFDYCLKIAVDAGGATEKRKIDLIETFNYLIGLTVQSQDRYIDKGYVFVDGKLPNGDAALVIWRDVDKMDNAALNRLLERRAVNPGNTEYAVIFVNGDHAIPNRKLGAAEGAPELKIRQLENVFLQKMFAED